MANQTKVKLYQKKAIVEFRRWHFEQVKNYLSVLDVAYQRIAPGDENDVTTKGEIRQIKEQGKSIEEVKKGKRSLQM
jgi:hypothetical protein